MITCAKCGNELPDNAKFCGKCGTPIHPAISNSESVPTSEPIPAEEPAPIAETVPLTETVPIADPIPVAEQACAAKPAAPGSILRASESSAHLVSATEAASYSAPEPVAPPVAIPVAEADNSSAERTVPTTPAYEMSANRMTAFEEAMSKKRKNQVSAFESAKNRK